MSKITILQLLIINEAWTIDRFRKEVRSLTGVRILPKEAGRLISGEQQYAELRKIKAIALTFGVEYEDIIFGHNEYTGIKPLIRFKSAFKKTKYKGRWHHG